MLFLSKMMIFFPCNSINPSFLNSESRRITVSVAVPTIPAISSLVRIISILEFSSPSIPYVSDNFNNVKASLSLMDFWVASVNLLSIITKS